MVREDLSSDDPERGSLILEKTCRPLPPRTNPPYNRTLIHLGHQHLPSQSQHDSYTRHSSANPYSPPAPVPFGSGGGSGESGESGDSGDGESSGARNISKCVCDSWARLSRALRDLEHELCSKKYNPIIYQLQLCFL